MKNNYKANVLNETFDKCYLQTDIDIYLLDRVRDSLGCYPEGRPAEMSKKTSENFLDDLPSNLSMLDQSVHINIMSNNYNRYLQKDQVLGFSRRFSTDATTSLRNKVLSCYK